ncbi:MAG: hypothetical protein ACYC4L_22460 [Chloroflexota bacterium]
MGRSILLRALVIAALLLVIGVAPVAALNGSPDAAVTLTSFDNKGHGSLTGNGAGAFRYYRFAYAGANAFVTVRLVWNPGWGLTDAAFGFNIYGPSGHVGEATHIDDDGDSSTRALTFSAALPGDYLVQVYNYAPEQTSNYTVEVIGLAEAPVVATGNTSIEGAVPARGPVFSANGSLVGSGGGAFNYFLVEYAGGDSPLDISLAMWPSRWLVEGAYGFNVYEDGTLRISGEEIARDPESATKKAFLQRLEPGKFIVQVYNYAEGVAADYTLAVSGAVGEVLPASGNDSPERALNLTPQRAAYRGTLAGSGGFAFFGMDYPGGSRSVRLILSFQPGPGFTATGVGYNVYRGGSLVMTGKVTEGASSNSGIAYATFNFIEGGYYGIQVYNYVDNTPVDYTFYAIGLPQ